MPSFFDTFKNLLQYEPDDEEEEQNLKDTVVQFEALVSTCNVIEIIPHQIGCDVPVKQNTDTTRSYRNRCRRQIDLVELHRAGLVQRGHTLRYQPRSIDGQIFYLGYYAVPKAIYSALAANKAQGLSLNYHLLPKSYVAKFTTLLFVEEAHQQVEMRRYDQFNAELSFYEGLFVLAVPGLAEGRPSLMKGDRVWLKYAEGQPILNGTIRIVREKDILFQLDVDWALEDTEFYVSFHTSRLPFRRCHHAIRLYNENAELDFDSILFPTTRNDFKRSKIEPWEKGPKKLSCITSDLNSQQKETVFNILKHVARPSPYIIFGPPGTGKTVTFCEAILQVYSRTEQTKILVCGNTNASADLIACKLKKTGVVAKDEVIRLVAFHRFDKYIEPELEEITLHQGMITEEVFRDCRIFITTIIQSGALYEFKQKFDYVFIDEASHATEPETLIPISQMKPDGSLVMAGDFKQLGPVCFSKKAKYNGLGISLMERLSLKSVYSRALRNGVMCYDKRYLTKLVISYRSDPRVLAVNNDLFYDNELRFVHKTPGKFMKLLKVDTPLVFHQINGKDRRESNNPSWFNGNEIIIILGYVKLLYSNGLKPTQLGIITPYRRQIDKLRFLFQTFGLEECKIGTTEEFQGDEREIIIVSTVRAREENVEKDLHFQLGFLFDPKRFNVTTSRAKWMTVVIGDGRILKRDQCWSKYIEKATRSPLAQPLETIFTETQ